MSDTTEQVLNFLRNTVDSDVDQNTALIDGGVLDSFHIVALISFIESEFDLHLRPTDVTHEDLVNAQSIVQLIERLKAGSTAK